MFLKDQWWDCTSSSTVSKMQQPSSVNIISSLMTCRASVVVGWVTVIHKLEDCVADISAWCAANQTELLWFGSAVNRSQLQPGNTTASDYQGHQANNCRSRLWLVVQCRLVSTPGVISRGNRNGLSEVKVKKWSEGECWRLSKRCLCLFYSSVAFLSSLFTLTMGMAFPCILPRNVMQREDNIAGTVLPCIEMEDNVSDPDWNTDLVVSYLCCLLTVVLL